MIQHINSFVGIENILRSFGLCDDSLILFDIDNVLLSAKDKILRPIGYQLAPKLLKEAVKSRDYNFYFAQIITQANLEIPEEATISLYNNLKNLNLLVLGITRTKTGYLKYFMNSLEDFKIKNLKKLGIDFKIQTSYNIDLDSYDLNIKSAFLKAGIIFSYPNMKGLTLRAFLNKFNKKFKKIILFDDELVNLISVKNMLVEKDIDFYGFHYVFPKLYYDSINYEVAKFQFKYLVENNIWLNDTECQKKLEELL